jgi:hypothetical protein
VQNLVFMLARMLKLVILIFDRNLSVTINGWPEKISPDIYVSSQTPILCAEKKGSEYNTEYEGIFNGHDCLRVMVFIRQTLQELVASYVTIKNLSNLMRMGLVFSHTEVLVIFGTVNIKDTKPNIVNRSIINYPMSLCRLNMKNEDEMALLYCIVHAYFKYIHEQENSDHQDRYKQAKICANKRNDNFLANFSLKSKYGGGAGMQLLTSNQINSINIINFV